jgi:hypothetical protein
VPEFGGFIANYKPATIDTVVNRIHPPSKSVLFNPNLLNNDGLLGGEVSKVKEIDYPSALTYIAKQVRVWKDELQKGGRVEIDEIGFLYKHNGTIVFEQNRQVNILLNAFGLSSVSFLNFESTEKNNSNKGLNSEVNSVSTLLPNTNLSLVEEEPSLEKAEELNDAQIIPISRKKKNRLKYLAVAAAIPFMFYSYWIPMETDFLNTGKIQVSDFNPLRKTKNKVYTSKSHADYFSAKEDFYEWEELTGHLSDNVEVYNFQFSETLFIPIRLKEGDISNANEYANIDLPYQLIVGCFSIKNNANSLVNELKTEGFSASILDHHKGLYRVTANGFKTLQEAENFLQDFKSNGNEGWILSK